MAKDSLMRLLFFETGIWYLGGSLSAYDLSGEQVLLDKAVELRDYLLNAFQFGVFPTGRVAVDPKSNSCENLFVLAAVETHERSSLREKGKILRDLHGDSLSIAAWLSL